MCYVSFPDNENYTLDNELNDDNDSGAIENFDSSQKKRVFFLLDKAKGLISYKPSIAYEYLNEAINIAKKLDCYQGLSYAYLLRGKLNKYNSNTKYAFLDFEDAQLYAELLKGVEKDTILGYINLGLGSLYGENDMLNEAFECYSKARTIAIKYDDNNMLNSAEQGLFIIVSKTENIEKAIKLQKEYAHGVESKLLRRGFYLNIGNNYINLGEPDSAILYFHKSLNLLPEKVDSMFIWTNWANLGIAYILKQEFKQALEYLEKAKNSSSKNISSRVYCELAKCNIELGNFFIAKKYLDIAEDQARDIKSYSSLNDILQNKINVYLLQEKWEKAYFTTLRLIESKDSLNDLMNVKKLAQSQLKLEYELKQKEKNYEHVQQILKIKNRRQKLTIIFLSYLSISLIILLVIILKFRKQKKINIESKFKELMLEDDLESMNKKLVSNILRSVQQKEIYDQVIISLKNLKENIHPKHTQELESITKKLKKYSDKNLWDEFDFSFGRVKLKFYDNLANSHPSLTPTDLRLCALLSLNLNTKEIASILNLSPNSIRVFRTRIRNKLGLRNSKVNLFEYLSNF